VAVHTLNVIDVRPSRCLCLLLAGGHALAAFSCLYLPGGWLQGCGLLALGLSLVHALRGQRLAPSQLGLTPDGGLHFVHAVQEHLPARVSPSTVVSAGAIWLAWDKSPGWPPGAILLCRDQMSAREWRTLQVWLRLGVGSQAATEAGGASPLSS